MWLPGWDSLQAVTRYHHWFEVGSVASLVLLGLVDVGLLVYGNRKEHLSEQAAAALLAAVRGEHAPRALTEPQKLALIAALAPLRGQKVRIAAPMNDAEAEAYAREFAPVLRNAGLVVVDIVGARYDEDPVGIEVALNVKPAEPDPADPTRVRATVPAFGLHFRDALTASGLSSDFTRAPNLPDDVVELRIGHKPPRKQ